MHTHTHTDTYTDTHPHTHTHPQTHTHRHIQRHTHMHSHTHTQTKNTIRLNLSERTEFLFGRRSYIPHRFSSMFSHENIISILTYSYDECTKPVNLKMFTLRPLFIHIARPHQNTYSIILSSQECVSIYFRIWIITLSVKF